MFQRKNKLFILVLALFLLSSSAHASGGESETFDLVETLGHHLGDTPIFPFNLGGQKVYEGSEAYDPAHHDVFKDAQGKYHFVGGLDLHITKRVSMMWIVCIFLLGVFIPAANLIAKNPYRVTNKFTAAIEAMLDFVKGTIVDNAMGHHGHSYYHYFFSLFFFILFCNFFGLLPPVGEILALVSGIHILGDIWSGITVTGDVSVTLSLALITFVLIFATAFIFQGVPYIWHSVPKGVPFVIWPLMWVLEFALSPVTRCFALTMRLLANMTAGHVAMITLTGFVFMAESFLVVPLAVLANVPIFFLEILVSFLQAFIFSLLTAVFIGSVMHRH